MIVSASALQRYYSCPAKYHYARKFRAKEIKPWLKWGLDAHALMEGKEAPYGTRRGWAYYRELKKLKEREGYEVIENELEQTFEIMPGVSLTRRIDVLGRLDGKRLLVDWKTANSPWDYVQLDGYRKAPKGSGFQAASYVLPPPGEKWPERIDFVVADGEDGNVFTYYRNQADEDNLFAAIKRLRRETQENIIIRNRGFGCKYCDFLAVCYGQKGWEDLYELRD